MSNEDKSNRYASTILHPVSVKYMMYRLATGGFDSANSSQRDPHFEAQADATSRSMIMKIAKDIDVPQDYSRVHLKDYMDIIKISLINGLPIFQKNTPKNSGRVLCMFSVIDPMNKTLYVTESEATSD